MMMTRTKLLCASALLLLVSIVCWTAADSAAVVSSKPQRRRRRRRRELGAKPQLFKTYGDAWESAAAGRSYVSTLQTDCIKRPEKKSGKKGSSRFLLNEERRSGVRGLYDTSSETTTTTSTTTTSTTSSKSSTKSSKASPEGVSSSGKKSKSSKKSKKSSSASSESDLPFCDEEDGSSESPPASSPVSSPDGSGEGNEGGDSGEGNEGGGDDGEGNEGDGSGEGGGEGNEGDGNGEGGGDDGEGNEGDGSGEGGGEGDSGQQGTPTAEPTGTVVQEKATRCELFFAGNAPTNTDNIPFTAYLTLRTDGSRPMEEMLVDVHDVLKTDVAADVMGCSRLTERNLLLDQRRVQSEDEDAVVNVVFGSLREQSGGSSVASTEGAVYYTGEFPEGILAVLRSAIANANFSGIDGLTGVGSVLVEDSSGNVFVGPADDNSSSGGNDDPGVSSVRGDPPVSQKSNISAGGYVGLAIAGLVVGLLVLFASRRRRRNRQEFEDDTFKQQQYHDVEDDNDEYQPRGVVYPNASTDDESEGYLSREDGTSPDHGERPPSRGMVRMVDDTSLWENQSRNARFQGAGMEGVESDEALMHHSCSSPTCALCQSKMANPITFVSPGEPPERESVILKTRDYVEADTVEL